MGLSECPEALIIGGTAMRPMTAPAIQHYGLKFERGLKVVLLSGAMGVVGSFAAYADTYDLPARA